MNKLLTQCISDAFLFTKVAEIMNLYSKVTGQTYWHIHSLIIGLLHRRTDTHSLIIGLLDRHTNAYSAC